MCDDDDDDNNYHNYYNNNNNGDNYNVMAYQLFVVFWRWGSIVPQFPRTREQDTRGPFH